MIKKQGDFGLYVGMDKNGYYLRYVITDNGIPIQDVYLWCGLLIKIDNL